MHPSVRSHDPHGKCPICNMNLIPVYKSRPGDLATAAPTARTGGDFFVPVERQQQIGVTYAVVARKPLRRSLRAVGTVAYATQRHWDIVARVQGYVQQLRVASAGELVEQGQPLLTLYGPDLLTTQHELVDSLRMRDEARRAGSTGALASAGQLIAAAERRLRLWNITPGQIADLEATRQPRETLTLVSPVRGIVHHIHTGQGQNVNPGDVLVDVADLSVVWVWAEVYQEELPLVSVGMPVTVTTSAYPNTRFTGTVAVVDPFLNDARRTGRLRLDIDNRAFKLRADMYVNAELELDAGEKLAVPVSAVLPTGERELVFVDKGAGRLEARFVELGGKFGDDYAVVAGLRAGERVVDSANFLIDAESKIQGAVRTW
ncbi:MAG: efflux RND transporter periplasmic adaptor subunit, partial [Verrucomicrobia bacterium]|nr:efflux RND transporter periplasmic adaptor subunit [Verrucomicrobiota bacterium]